METPFFENYQKSILRALFISIFIIIGLILIIFSIYPKEDISKDLIEKFKKEKQEIINRSYNQIDSLKRLNELQEETIDKANFKIDSLKHIKTKVEIVYQNKLKQINEYNSKQIENYWQEQFNK
jgi:hypothetical protein